jgi:hypothetical protein
MRRLTAALALVLLAACEVVPSEDFTPVTVVHGFVYHDPAAPAQVFAVNVNRTYAITEQPESLVTDASVRVAWLDSTWTLPHAARDRYETALPGRLVAPGDTVRLVVARPGFDTVFATTVIPDTFAIRWPRTGDTITVRDSLVWTRGDGIGGWFISVTMVDSIGREPMLEFVFPNDSIEPGFPLYFLARAPEGRYELAILSLDRNYYNWAARGFGGPGGFNESDTFDLVGGVGVFGSGMLRTVRFCFRCDTIESLPAQRLPPGVLPVQSSIRSFSNR